MYIGVLAVVLGWTFLSKSLELLGYAALLALCFHAFIRLYEEPALRNLFGTEYEQYTAEVGRWFPRWPVSQSVGRSGDREIS
jgi:protein-S-isoprenylcysteine O-methyltransferase Ste14